jgi:hypothetical protein
MRRSFLLLVGCCWIVIAGAPGCGYFSPPKIVDTGDGLVSPALTDGQKTARQYLAGTLMDYELVWELYDLDAKVRPTFLDGFVEEFTRAGSPTRGMEYRGLLEEAISGTQFQTALELGTKHAARSVTNEQVQGVIRSSLGVSKGVALGWKAGYIRGFAAWRLAEAARTGTVNEAAIQRFHLEAATTYQALRAAVGQ